VVALIHKSNATNCEIYSYFSLTPNMDNPLSSLADAILVALEVLDRR